MNLLLSITSSYGGSAAPLLRRRRGSEALHEGGGSDARVAAGPFETDRGSRTRTRIAALQPRSRERHADALRRGAPPVRTTCARRHRHGPHRGARAWWSRTRAAPTRRYANTPDRIPAGAAEGLPRRPRRHRAFRGGE